MIVLASPSLFTEEDFRHLRDHQHDGNILSYARIMAIGMASVILALVANTLGGMAEVAIVGFVIAALLMP